MGKRSRHRVCAAPKDFREVARDSLARWFADKLDEAAYEALKPVVIKFEVVENEGNPAVGR